MTKTQLTRIWTLTASFWVAAFLVWIFVMIDEQPLSNAASIHVLLFAFGVAAVEAETAALKLLVRSRSATYSFMEIPIILGVLYVDPGMIVPVVAITSFLVYRTNRGMVTLKAAFNAGKLTLRHASTWWIVSLFPAIDPLSPRGWVLVGLATFATSIVDGIAIGTVSAIADGQDTIKGIRSYATYAHFVSFTATTQGLIVAIMLRDEPLSLVLFAVSISMFYVASRAYVDESILRVSAEESASTDALTKIANRAAFETALAEATVDSATRVSIAYIDLDNFKTINDTYGHLTGDAVLVETSRRLLKAVRGDDLVARLGGDEFAVLLESNTEHDDVIERIRFALNSEFVTVGGTVLPTAASVGHVERLPNETNDQFVSRADQAMYEQKQARRADNAPMKDARDDQAALASIVRLMHRNQGKQ